MAEHFPTIVVQRSQRRHPASSTSQWTPRGGKGLAVTRLGKPATGSVWVPLLESRRTNIRMPSPGLGDCHVTTTGLWPGTSAGRSTLQCGVVAGRKGRLARARWLSRRQPRDHEDLSTSRRRWNKDGLEKRFESLIGEKQIEDPLQHSPSP